MLIYRLRNGEFSVADMASNGHQSPSYCKVCYNQKRKIAKALRLER